MSHGALQKNGAFTHYNTTPPQSDRLLPLFSLRGRTAIITGAGAGIGLACARAFAEAGANVAICYNSNKDAIDRAREIKEEFGVKCEAYKVNVMDADEVKNSVDQIVRDFNGRVDVFVANSGVPWMQGQAIKGEPSHYRKVMATDLDGVFYSAQAVGAHFKRQKLEGKDINGNRIENFTYGSFIGTASMSGHIVNVPQLQAAYVGPRQNNASKAGVIHLCRSLAVEWVKYARVNTISPGYITTDISSFVSKEMKDLWLDRTPMGREGDANELKGAYLYLASDASSYTTGADIIIDGGYCLP